MPETVCLRSYGQADNLNMLIFIRKEEIEYPNYLKGDTVEDD